MKVKIVIAWSLIILSTGSLAKAPDNMVRDYQKWMRSTKVGTEIDWAEGKLTRTDNGARYIDKLGMITMLPEKDPDFDFIAKDNPNIAKQWHTQYGFSPAKTEKKSPAESASPSASSPKTSSDHLKSIEKLKSSSVMMLIEASKKYKNGSLTKDKFIEVALQVAQTAEYEHNVNGAFTTTEDANKWLEVNQAILPKMRNDYKNFMSSTPLGSVVDWAGGKLYRRSEGFLFVGPDGDSILLNDNPSGAIDFNFIALNNSSIAAEWKKQYGFTPVGETRFQNQRGFSADSFTNNIPSDASTWYPTTYGENIRKWIKENYNSLKVGESKKWDNQTIVRTGGPYCLIIMSGDGTRFTKLCDADDFARNLPNDPFASELAKKYWGY